MTLFANSLLHTGMPVRVLYALFIAACLGNGLWLLLDPAGWDATLRTSREGVGAGDALPAYVLRKTGVLYLCLGTAFAGCLASPSARPRVHLLLTGFFVLVAVVHGLELVSTGAPPDRWLLDTPLVFLPALVLMLMMVPLPDLSRREQGTVKWFDSKKGFGFIVRDTGEEIFVHYRAIRGRGHRALRDGQPVRFRVVTGDKGLQADDVSP